MLVPDDYIYLDHNATTPICPEAVNEINKMMHIHGNPSSSHPVGQKAKLALEEYRKLVGDSFNVESKNVIYMSGGTEVNNTIINLAVQHYWKLFNKKPVIITAKIEHPSILNVLENLKNHDRIDIEYIPIDKETCMLKYKEIDNNKLQNCALITLMYANNETGVIQPINEIYSYYKRAFLELQKDSIYRPIFHTDASQVIGRVPLLLSDIDAITVTGHKFGGPCIAALITSNNQIIKLLKEYPFIFGGGQEFGVRSGTENLPMIAGLSVAIHKAFNTIEEFNCVKEIRDYFESQLVSKFNCKSFYKNVPRLPNTASIVFPDINTTASDLLSKCEKYFAASTGAACHADTIAISPCLLAFGRTEDEAIKTVRFSLGKENTKQQIDKVLSILENVFIQLKK